MAPITTDLATVLRTVRRPGDFYASGTVALPAPSLAVDGVGPIALPLLPFQAEQLVAAAARAPYGRGQDTVIDTQVRRTWQISADRISIGGKHWPATLGTIVERATEGLGVEDPVTAELYKLLIYDEGSFFVSHRDTEKSPGMFATLVIVLPSLSSGGELVVRHRDREVRLDLRCDDPSEAAFAAFYADCPHEVLPVTTGCRLVLVYNLLRPGTGPAPQPPGHDREQARIAALLRTWATAERDPDAEATPEDLHPDKLVYKLEHAYTPAELGFAALKGADAAAATVMTGAAARAECDLHLALLTIEESGPAEYDEYAARRRGRWSRGSDDDDKFEVIEISDRSVTLTDWRRPDGQPSSLGALPVDTESELSPPDAFEGAEPDEQHFQEATGNEGASFERTYRRAAFVLWPSRRVLAVLNQAGLDTTLPYLADLADRWVASAGDQRSDLWTRAHELAGHMLRTWPSYRPYEHAAPSNATKLLTQLTRLGDTQQLDAFLTQVPAVGHCARGDNPAILAALATLAPVRAIELVERIIAGTAPISLGMCGDLLARATTALPRIDPVALRTAGAILLDALPGGPSRGPPRPAWERAPTLEPGFIVDLFNALGRIEQALVARATDHILAWPKTYAMDTVLVPASCSLMGSAVMQASPAARRLHTACLDHLRARVAQTLEPPRNWRRPSQVGCDCPHCSMLTRFLADPAEEIWTLRAAMQHRAHVEATIKSANCDLNLVTERRGSPHSLICTKNQASYERRVKQCQDDLAHIQHLQG